ncbi:hypothetical protein OSB04_028379 [Centaurea solstitialis]|uniref:Integrase catalytic domain-containing protein n=1 Tax=Centaurea solstitialis TaxID=347529 RepID=A0AA38SGD2_9ASTR|nr:hypothetical protein OSB04_028379 [Centaurea solstitialis]
MASQNTIPNDVEPKSPLIIVSLTNILKLTTSNYMSWKLQVKATLIGYGLYKFLDGSCVAPPALITLGTTSAPNPAFTTWVRQDKLLFGSLIGTLDPTVVPLVSRSTSSKQLWDTLANTFAKQSRGREKLLKVELKTITKGPLSISEYMNAIKILLNRILEGLGSDYQAVIDAVHARDSPISFDDLHEKLLKRESTIKTQSAPPSLPVSAHVTATRQHNHGSSGYGATSFNAGHSSLRKGSQQQSNRKQSVGYQGTCQWCHTKGHSLHLCPVFQQRFPSARPPPRPTFNMTSPQAHVATANTSGTTSPWLLDTGATHHVTHDLSNLALHQPYDGTEEIVIGDGAGVPITHTDSTSFLTSSAIPLILSNILCAPRMTRNIMSIYKLCLENNLLIEFSSNSFVIKDRLTGAHLTSGPSKQGIYEWPSNPSILAFSTIKASAIDWHHRLGHPSLAIFKSLVSTFKLDVPRAFSFNCNSCQCNKSHKLPFSQSTLISHAPLDLVYTDLWTSPIYSIDGFKYYVIFVDHYTKYIWFYPLQNKSDTKTIFIRFKALVEKFFETKIKVIHSDNGGAYQALASFLTIEGVSHLTSPPHTPEHNGYAERRHRHIVETGHMPSIRLPISLIGCRLLHWITSLLFFVYTSRHVRFVESEFPYKRLTTQTNFPPIPNPDTWCPLMLSILQQPQNEQTPLESQSQPGSMLQPSMAVSTSLESPLVDSMARSNSPEPSDIANLDPHSIPSVSIEPQPNNLASANHPAIPLGIVTRSKNNIHKPNPKYANLVGIHDKPTELTTVAQALKSPLWRKATEDEIRALHALGTWNLVAPDTTKNLVKCRWVFRIKYHPDGTIDRYKARLVAKGFQQRPGIDYTETFSPVVKPLVRFMHRPTSSHWAALKRLLRYLCGTMDKGINILKDSPLCLHAFSDADWGGDKDDYTSTMGYVVFLGKNPITWTSKKQRSVARSSTEAEYRAVASTTAELTWVRNLLGELGVHLSQSPVIYCDNLSATQLSANPVFHSKMKHLALDFYFIREQVQNGALRVTHVSSDDQLADSLTKPLSRPRLDSLSSKIGLSHRPSILRGNVEDNH